MPSHLRFTPNSVGYVTVSTPGTPVPLASSSIPCWLIRVQPRQSNSVENIGNVYLKNASGKIFAIIAPEQVEGYEWPPLVARLGYIFDLADWFLDADNAGDGALVGYFP